MNHDTARAKRTGAVFKKRGIVVDVLDDRPRDDQVRRLIANRKSRRRSVSNDLATEVVIAPQLLLGAVKGHDKVTAGLLHEREKWAILTPADVENQLSWTAVDRLGDFVFV